MPATSSAIRLAAMGRRHGDDRDNREVMAELEKHLVAVAPGETKRVSTYYAGRQDITVASAKKCKQWKCKHCVALFCGDARRCARHFLPTSLPKRLELSPLSCVAGVTMWTTNCYGLTVSNRSNLLRGPS